MADLKTRIIISAVDNTKAAFNSANQAADKLKSTLLSFVGIAFTGAFVKELTDTADKWLLISTQIRNATNSSDEFAIAQKAIIDISNKTYTSLEANSGLFSKINLALKALGGNSSQSIEAVDQIVKLVALSGTSASAAAAGIFQFTQSLAANRFSGQEYNSVAEQTPALLKAIYEGLGVNIGQLRKMAEEGQLDTATVLGAIEKSSARTNAAFEKIPLTLGKSFQYLENQWLIFIGRLNESSGVTDALAKTVKLLSDNLKGLAEIAADVGASLIAGGIASAIALIINYTKATALATLETKSNIVANAQAQAAEKARIAALQAKVASQLADVRAQVAQTKATLAQTTMQINQAKVELRSLIIQSQTSEVMARRLVLQAELTALNTAAAEQQAILNEQLLAQNAILTAGNARILSFSTIFNGFLAGFVGYEIGSWAKRNFTWMESATVGLQQLFDNLLLFKDFATFKINSTQFKQGLKDIEEKYAESYLIIGQGSENQRAEYEEQRKKEAEAAKEAEEKKIKVFEDGFKKQQATLETKNELRKASFEQELTEIDLISQTRLAELSKGVMSDDAHGKRAIEIQRQTEQQKLDTTIKYNQARLKDTSELYAKEIALQKSRNLSTAAMEKEAAQAKKAILLESEKAYSDSIKKSIEAEKQLRDKALDFRKELIDFQRTTSDRSLRLQNIGLSEKQQFENASLKISQDASLVRKQLTDGDLKAAEESAKKNTELAFEQATSAKQAFLEGKISRDVMETAEFDYQQTVEQTNKTLSQAAVELNKQAAEEVKKRNKQITSLEDFKAKIIEVDTAIKTISKFEMIVDSKQIDDLKTKIENEIPKEKIINIKWTGGESIQTPKPQGFATGGFVGGTGTGDTVPALLTPQEYVLTVPETKMLNGMGFFSWLKSPSPQKFSSGGIVKPASLPAFTKSKPQAASGESVNVNLSLGGSTTTLTGTKSAELDTIIKSLKKAGRVK